MPTHSHEHAQLELLRGGEFLNSPRTFGSVQKGSTCHFIYYRDKSSKVHN